MISPTLITRAFAGLKATAQPQKIRFSLYLLWSTLVLGLCMQFLAYGTSESFGTPLRFGALLVSELAVHTYFIVGISRRRNSARWVYLLLFVFGLLLSPPRFADFTDEPIASTVEIAQDLMKALAFLLLFTKSGNRWFASTIAGSEHQLKKVERLIHRDGKIRTIRIGFCWPGFLLTGLWAMSEGMWRPFACVLLAVLMSRLSVDASHYYGNPAYGVVALLAYPITMMLFGLRGNKWLITSLQQRGYTVVEEM